MYHIFSVNPTYPLNRVVESVRERDEIIADFKSLHPTIPVYYQKVKEG